MMTIQVDPLTEFLANLSPVDVERERLPSFRVARREAFSGSVHRAMLFAHEINLAKYRRQVAVNEAFIYRQQKHDTRRTAA